MNKAGKPVAVIGSGILGTLAALLLARSGRQVLLFEASDGILGGASVAGEAKVHLGPVYALGDPPTQRSMIQGAFAFQPIIEAALGSAIDWDRLASEPFSYVVMPDSLVSPDYLAARYALINQLLSDTVASGGGSSYLARSISIGIETEWRTHPVNGLPMFPSEERAVDNVLLAGLLRQAVFANPKIEVRTGARVIRTEEGPGGATLLCRASDGEFAAGPFDAVLNCAWEDRAGIVLRSGHSFPITTNYRIKQGIHFRTARSFNPVTLVQGPFGDVVDYGKRGYASWYPECRIRQEVGKVPSPQFESDLSVFGPTPDSIEASLAPFRRLALIPEDTEVTGFSLGAILGEGLTDIADIGSGLHSRNGDRILVNGSIITSLNYKFTTAPLAAQRLCSLVEGG
jgi:hypothetical protein